MSTMEVVDKVNNLKEKFNNGEILSVDEIVDLRNEILKSKLEDKVKYGLLESLTKFRRKSTNLTKWDIFVDDMSRLDGVEELNELIKELNEKKDEDVTKEEISDLENKYASVLGLIHEKLNHYDRDVAINEINKKIKLFENRLDRCIEVDFGKWIKELRNEKGLSLKQLENISGVTSSYIHRIENGARRRPSVGIAEKLAKALEVNPAEFLEKLNLTSDIEVREEVPLRELLIRSKFTINNNSVNKEQKDALLNIVTKIIDANWTTDTKTLESIELITLVDKFKEVLK